MLDLKEICIYVGKRRMEPLAVLILSVIMAMASTMVIIKSMEAIQDYATQETVQAPKVEIPTIIIISSTVGLYFYQISIFFVTTCISGVHDRNHCNK